jgi:hypothetical protein
MMSTRSEQLFESFCRVHGVACRRVSEATSPRPDYVLELEGQHVLAEVKQFDPNKEERAAIQRRAKGEHVALGGKPGARLRDAIGSANTQLRELLAGRSMSTILVVYNNTPCSLHTQPYAVMTAMQGLDVVDLEVPIDPSESPRFGDTRSGPERKMRVDANTSTSAVAVLTDLDLNEFRLAVYHNRHAASPLEPRVMRFPGVVHLRLPQDASNSVEAQWQAV